MSDERPTTPSPRAVRRLGEDIGSEVGDLRAALRAALDEADRHEAEGRPDRAAAVLSEQREVLADVHRRLEERIAAAAVEREAEGVLAAVEPVHESSPTATAVPAVETAPVPAAGRTAGDGMALRLLASVAAGVVGVVLLLVPDTGGMLTAADWSGVDRGEDTTPVVDPDAGSGTAADAEVPETTSSWSTSSHLGRIAPRPLTQPGGSGHASTQPGPDDDHEPTEPDLGPRLPGASLSEVTGLLEGFDDLEPPVLDSARPGDDEAGDDETSDEDSTASEGDDDDAARGEHASSSGLGDVADADGEGVSSAR